VGGLPVAVRDGVSGALVDGHDPEAWAQTLGTVLAADPATLSRAAVEHASTFSWAHTVDALLAGYGRAIGDHRADNQPQPAGRRSSRRFSMRRGVRA
ncbi:D-inositol-3-phosphate glycosyltransferase, partial [Mycobacterium sp. ITM-2017-0098]